MIQSYVGMTNLNKNELPYVSMIESHVSMTIGQNGVPCVSMIESYVSMTIRQEMKYHA
jgi:hypothetical protein